MHQGISSFAAFIYFCFLSLLNAYYIALNIGFCMSANRDLVAGVAKTNKIIIRHQVNFCGS